jgi:hypothetical protein
MSPDLTHRWRRGRHAQVGFAAQFREAGSKRAQPADLVALKRQIPL